MSFTDPQHADLFNAVAPHIRIEIYARDGGHLNPRKRIELDAGNLSSELRRRVLAFTMPCVACGRTINPFRVRAATSKRGGSNHVYFAAACPLHVEVGCSRGLAARNEYIQVSNAILSHQPPVQA